MRPSALRRGLHVRAHALRNEQGMALVMALGIMMVLSLALGTVIYLSAAGARDAQRTNAAQKALALAETGLNNVIAQIASHYPNPTSAGNTSWAAGPASPVGYEGGTATWSGTFDSSTNVWTVTGTGTVQNPTGPGAANVARTVTAKLNVSATPPPYVPYGLIASDPNAGCTLLRGNISVNVPVYIGSCLTLSGTTDPPAPLKAKIWEPNNPPTVSVRVGGQLSVTGGTTVGIATTPIKSIAAGSCSPSPCSAANGFYATTYPPFSASATGAVDAQAIYSSANWAGATCVTGSNPFDNNSTRNNSKGTVGPDNGWTANFDCSVTDPQGATHRLAYNVGTRTLTIQGSVFIDGNFMSSPNRGLKYTGDGTIYFNGTVTHSGVICGPGSSFTAPGTCGKTWDQSLGKLLLVACNATTPPVSPPSIPFVVQSQAVLEAGAWGVANASSSTAFQSVGGAYLGGSVFTSVGSADVGGGGVLHAFLSLPAGSPTSYVYTLSRPTNYSGG